MSKRSRESADDGKSLLTSAAEIAFPRGGASVLTPLEKKEIANEVKKDILFSTTEPPKKKSKKTKGLLDGFEGDEDSESITIDHLNINILQPGSFVLAQIKKINQMDLVVSLPDDLVASIPITNISDELTKQLELFNEQENSDDDDSDFEMDVDSDSESNSKSKSNQKPKEKIEFPDLKFHFQVGQWIRGQVVSNVDEKQRKRIELTIDPSKVNSSLDEKEDLTQNNVIQASVKSIEDHGIVLNIGSNFKKSGFISKKEIGDIIENIQIGSVLLLTITKTNERAITCKIPSSFGPIKKHIALSTFNSIDTILPGSLVDATITKVTSNGIIAKVGGILDAYINCDHLHLSEISAENIKQKFSVGSNIKSRVIATYLKNTTKKAELSILPHLLTLSYSEENLNALEAFPIGHIFDSVKVKGKDSSFIYIDVLSGNIPARAHKSKISKSKDIDMDYKIGSTHKARVLNYSPVNNYYILTLNSDEIEQQYLRPQDIPVGSALTCVVEKVSEKGIKIKVADLFPAFVDAANMSDVKLNYPERKFKVGSKIRGRLLKTKTNGFSTRLFVTFKKSLVNADNEEIVTSYDQLKPERKVPATIVKILPSGCVCTFFNDITGFLPNSEISEAFVHSAKDHVKEGQTVRVRIISSDAEEKKCLVSLRVSNDFSDDQTKELQSLIPGRSIEQATILDKEREMINVEFGKSKLRGVIEVAHLSDGTADDARHLLKKFKIGSTIDTLVLAIDSKRRAVTLTAKPSLVTDAKNGILPSTYSDIQVSDKILHGWVKSVIPGGVFVSFANGLTGLVLPQNASEKSVKDLTKAFKKNQSVKCTVLRVDNDKERFLLSLKANAAGSDSNVETINPVDKSINVIGDYVPGKITKASVKAIENDGTGLLVKLADNVEGRIDLTESAELTSGLSGVELLNKFNPGKKLDVKVIGFKNLSNGSFRSAKRSESDIIELTIKPSAIQSSSAVQPLSFENVEVGDEVVGYVSDNVGEALWIAVSPSLKVYISAVDITEDAEKISNIEENFKIGTIVKAKVTKVDTEHHVVVVSARENTINSIDDVSSGAILPATVIKVLDNGVLVSLGNGVTARADSADSLDNYDEKIQEIYKVGDVISAKVYEVDIPNRKISVALRQSAISSKVKPNDVLFTSADELERGSVVRGFITKIINSGLIVSLGHGLVALVRVSDLSDAFVKDWKSIFTLHQVVKGKILSSEGNGRILMTLKNSIVQGDLKDVKSFDLIKEEEIYEGTVKKALEFGVFIALDGTNGISGLCHRSEISDSKIDNCEDLFAPGDRVKVKVLKVDTESKKLSLGMKASYFMDEQSSDADDDVDDIDVEMEDVETNEAEAADADADAENDSDNESDEEMVEVNDVDSESEDEADASAGKSEDEGLSVGGLSAGFDWTASILEQARDEESSDEEEEFRNEVNKKKKESKSKTVEDKTAELSARAPQSIADFERLLIGNPDSSILWIQYMSFQLQLSEIEKAREIAERALKTINYRDEQEKLNIWVALLNLENSFGDEDTLDVTFKRSCQYMEPSTMHNKLVTIYTQSEKFDKAEKLYSVICKKFGSENPSSWVSYANFLLDRDDNDGAHEVLGKALQSLPKKAHVDVVRKFAQLEFQKGDAEQGRSLFEGLLSDVPKRIDLWNVYIDQEVKFGKKKNVDDLFERVIERKLTRKQAKFFFAKWLGYEEKMGDEKAQDYVKAKAAEYAQKLSQ
ncbi:Rrp5 protein [Martiniozyma asiatica (nom. inval.)]|nr:Rrp5 protein [Martiniozyma asiatica]